MIRSLKCAATPWLMILALGSARIASAQEVGAKVARFSGADIVVVDMTRLIKTFEPLRTASSDLRREAAAARSKLAADLRTLEMHRQEKVLTYARGTPEFRKQEEEFWRMAWAIYHERVLFTQTLHQRQAEAYASAHSRLQQEVQHFQREYRIGAVVNSGVPFEIPELEPASDLLLDKSDIGFSRDRGVLWWTTPGVGATLDAELRRYELPQPPTAAKAALPGEIPFERFKLPEPSPSRPLGPSREQVQEQINRQVVAFSPELDITAAVEERLSKAMKRPGQAEPGVGADSR